MPDASTLERESLSILVLDDDAFTVALLTHMLRTQGCTRVSACERGEDALALVVPEEGPELILCDLNMPGMDGIEFVRRLVDRGFQGSLILVSGEEPRLLKTAEQLVKAHGIPVLDCLSKPVSPERLGQALARWRPRPSARVKAGREAYPAEAVARAIAQGELVNFYQPKVEVASGRVVGVETLVRWRHPEDGLVFPDQFIAVAEAHGLIDDLTRVVLAAALVQTRAWQEAGLDLRVAVNVSMDNLAALAFADFVALTARDAGVAPQQVVLEVTESRLMGDLRAPLEVLTRLRLKRFHLSIDDFGTGHSSFTQLRNIPFNELKIDQSFVHGAATDGTARAIYDASLGLGRQLDMEVVAEGVEDLEDWAFLQATGCPLAQGYFIARPMPAPELADWVLQWADRAQALCHA